MKLNHFFGVCLAALALSGCASVDNSSANQSNARSSGTMSDTVMQMRANQIVTNTPALQANSNVDVVVFNGIVLLTGQVPSQALSDQLAEQMSKINGVRAVYNELTVGDIGNVGQYLNDGWITSRVISSLVANKINSLKFKVVTTAGVVYMMGVVTPEEGQAAAEVASRVSGVRKVIKAYSYVTEPQPAPSDSLSSDDVDSQTSNPTHSQSLQS